MVKALINNRVLSGMRPTGALHLGNYHGALKNWVRMQDDYECYYFVADWHALTTHYDAPQTLNEHVLELVVDWLAAGINPQQSTLFIQSFVPEHAELHLLLSMITPLPWLERVPTFKDQQQKLRDKDLVTYGFLGYPLLQSADILMYRAAYVPVGEDQVPHIEFTREVARRFNHFFGRGADFEKAVDNAFKQMGKKTTKCLQKLKVQFCEQGDKKAQREAVQLIQKNENLSDDQKELVHGYFEDRGRAILPEPEALLTEAPKVPGLDGQKMSKSYGNTIALRDDAKRVKQAIQVMPTDPARVRLSDPGDPEKCPVWKLHQIYSDDQTRQWIMRGCPKAEFGCLDCKKPLIDKILQEQQLILERAQPYVKDPNMVKDIIVQGSAKAREEAKNTIAMVREVIGTAYP